MAIRTEPKTFQDVLFGAFERTVKGYADEIVERHKEQMAEEIEQATIKAVAEVGLMVSRQVQIQTMTDRVVIELVKRNG